MRDGVRRWVKLSLCSLSAFSWGCGTDAASPADSGRASAEGTGSIEGGTDAPADGGGTLPALDSVGVGVSDLDASTAFFTAVLGMTLRAESRRSDRTERVLVYGAGEKGSSLTLMHFDDGRSIANVPAKLVFYTPDINATVQRLADAGSSITQAPLTYMGAQDAMAVGPDGYTIELVQQSTTEPLVLAVGFAVRDLQASVDFYTHVMGMKQTGEYDLGTLTEKVMQYSTGHGSAVVLQGYTDMAQRNYENNPVLQVHEVADADATAQKIAKGGGSIVTAAAPDATLGNEIVAMTKDPDGYLLELVQ
jgi:catechol 2,3-dioxygenase-like lactoylglutathione lyase family enzyme